MQLSFSTFFIISRHIPGSIVFVSHFPCFSVFLATIHVLQYAFFIIQGFQCFSQDSSSYSICASFSTFFWLSCHYPCPTVSVSHFPKFSVFLPYFRSHIEHFSFFTFFNISYHIQGHTFWISPFPCSSFFSPYSRL
jgi:hypothetical protein